MYRLLILTILLVFYSSGQVWSGDLLQDNKKVLSLEETVRLGLERNPRIKAGEYGIKRSESEIKSARGRFFPQASAGAGYTHLKSIYASGPTDSDYLDQSQYHWNLRLVQTIFAGMTILNTYQKARIQKEISELEKESVERELIREIQYYFLGLLKAKEDRISIENTIERLEVGLETAEAFYKVRLVPFADVLQAEVELEEAKQALSQIRNEVMVLRTRLNSLLGFSYDYPIEYSGDLQDISTARVHDPEDALKIALEQRTDLEFIRKNMETVQKEMSIAKGRKMPVVNFEVNYFDRTRDYTEKGMDVTGRKFDRDQTNHFWTAGINIQWNFFSGGQNYYRSESMDFEIKRLEQVLEDAASSIISEARTAYMRLNEARERFVSTRKAIDAARENHSMQEHRFKHRVGTIKELLTAQEQLARAEVRRNQALLDYQLALSELYFAMGDRNYGLD